MSFELIVLGEFDSTFLPHKLTNEAIFHSARAIGVDVLPRWVSTNDILHETVLSANGLWVAPGSPYRNLVNAIEAIRNARENGVPCLGTCGGFQHMIIEFARNVLEYEDAQHAEYDPYSSNLFVSRLECSLVGREMDLQFNADSLVAKAYGASFAREQYYCNFGVSLDRIELLESGLLKFVGKDSLSEARVLEIPDHPFFVGTLFIPQAKSTVDNPHPLVTAFLEAVINRGRRC
jgi:CTP synthase (UTP-ammonia lyase)